MLSSARSASSLWLWAAQARKPSSGPHMSGHLSTLFLATPKWLFAFLRSCHKVFCEFSAGNASASSTKTMLEGSMRKIFALTFAAILLSIASSTTALATDWCAAGPLPASAKIIVPQTVIRYHGWVQPWWYKSHLPGKVWCRVWEGGNTPVVFCLGYNDSVCGPYPYMTRNINTTSDSIYLRVANDDTWRQRYVAIFADYVNPGLHYHWKRGLRCVHGKRNRSLRCH